jgi:hypothetical protein
VDRMFVTETEATLQRVSLILQCLKRLEGGNNGQPALRDAGLLSEGWRSSVTDCFQKVGFLSALLALLTGFRVCLPSVLQDKPFSLVLPSFAIFTLPTV